LVQEGSSLSNQCNDEVESLRGSLRVGLKTFYAALNNFDLDD
jgi:hypothetical protein